MRPTFYALLAAATAACAAPPLPCGDQAGSTTIPGVTIAVDTASCSVPAGSGATFDYTTKVTTALTFMTPAHSGCSPTLDDPSSFIRTEVEGGSNAVYCPDCDLPTCPEEDPGEMITIPPGTYTGTLNWPGDAWNGPGDSHAPLGAPFPAGAYNMHVVFTIPGGAIDSKLAFTVE